MYASKTRLRRAVLLAAVCWVPAGLCADPDVQRGEYLVTILGCGGCHTEGALLGNPTGPWLAGSRTGVAWTSYAEDDLPGIVFPGNLTSDRETGLGRWTRAQIVELVSSGRKHTGERAVPVMPWPNYGLLKPDDAAAIADYLMSLPPVRRNIPAPVPQGTRSPERYVRIGVYLFDPAAAR